MQRTRAELQAFFQTNAIPTQSNFADLIDSTLNEKDDLVTKVAGNPLTIQDNGAEGALLTFCTTGAGGASTQTWLIKQKPAGAPTTGLTFQDASGKSPLFLQTGTGYIGVGTTNPAACVDITNPTPALHLTGPKAIVRLQVTNATGGLDVVGADGKTPLPVSVGSNGIYVDASGNVGIGTATPGFHLAFSDGLGDKIALWGQSGDTIGFGIQTSLFQIHGNNNSTDIAFGFGSSAKMTELMRIKGNGCVGIGVTNPQNKLELAGNLHMVGNSIFLRGEAPTDQYDVIKWNQKTDRVDIGGYQGVALGHTQGTPGSVNPIVTIEANGSVGIGTNNPTRGKLEILGGLPVPGGGTVIYEYLNFTQANHYNGSSAGILYSIWTDQRIAGSEFNAYSDARIKDIRGRSDGAADLETLSQIEVTSYTHKDTVAKDSRPHKKVIGQQVERVFPDAVSVATDTVPDIYQEAAVRDGWVALATDLEVGDRVRLIGAHEAAIHEVLEVREDAFRTSFQPAEERIFVYGREVNDFRVVDYDAIAMLNVSATQELHRRVQRQTAQILACQQKINTLEERLTAFEAVA